MYNILDYYNSNPFKFKIQDTTKTTFSPTAKTKTSFWMSPARTFRATTMREETGLDSAAVIGKGAEIEKDDIDPNN